MSCADKSVHGAKLQKDPMDKALERNPNLLVQYLNKPAFAFTKADLINYVENNKVEMVNFRYVGGDGRLKSLNFVINSLQHLDTILSAGERVDGSSLFSHIEAGSSDLYVVPRYKTAFVNPFAEIRTLDILCSYFDKDGNPLESSPAFTLHKAVAALKEHAGLDMEAMGELEYYVINEKNALFPPTDQKGYHESTPFAKGEPFRAEAMRLISQSGGMIKYGHSEVGDFFIENKAYEQNEIEFTPTCIEDAADQLITAKWILRSLAYRHGLSVTFAPKITVGKAGSGLHVHMCLLKEGKSLMTSKGKLSDTARRAIAGFMTLAPSLTAFGNTNPTSYFRLVPNQEAPTNVCWGDRNRSVLVRVPLGWNGTGNMINLANPLEPVVHGDFSDKQTVEFRCPDGSADIYLLMAGLTVAVRHGLGLANALEIAERTYVDVNVFQDQHKAKVQGLEQLPVSCWDSAARLEEHQDIYKKHAVFSQSTVDGVIKSLRQFNDKELRSKITNHELEMSKLVERHFHCG
jgi:glutamine synthetase